MQIVLAEARPIQKFSPTDRWPLFGEKGFWMELDDVVSFQPVRRLPTAAPVNMKLESQLLSCNFQPVVVFCLLQFGFTCNACFL